jgi:hypothetical protein
MSSRPQLDPINVLPNGDMSQASLTSAVTIIKKISMMSYACSWAGTAPVGTISVQVSNDYTINSAGVTANPGTWSTLTLSGPTNVSGNSGTGFIDLDQLAAYAIRLVYTKTSGTGVLNVVANGKVA